VNDFNGLLQGADGKLSIRRILGLVAILSGLALAWVESFMLGDWTRFIGAMISIGAGFLMFGWVTVQNIADAAKKAGK